MNQRGSNGADDRWLKRIVIVFASVGLLTRLINLGSRPLHHDESLDAWFSLRFLEGTYGGYDPVYHGPLRFYLVAGLFWLLGESDITARLLPAISGVFIVCIPWIWRKHLGFVGAASAMGLLVISPSMIYFSRFGREDMLFLFITIIFVSVFLAYVEKPKGWHPAAILTSLIVGMAVKESVLLLIFLFGVLYLLLLLKESLIYALPKNQKDRTGMTFSIQRWILITGMVSILLVFLWIGAADGEATISKLLAYGALLMVLVIGSFILAHRKGNLLASSNFAKGLRTPTRKQWVLSLVIPAVVFVGLFSQFFTSFLGPKTTSAPHGALRNGLTAGFNYWASQQESGSRGDSRWHYYLTLLSAYEWVVLILAIFGIWGILRRPTLFGEVMFWWAGGTLIIYSWASERMPWLVIHPLFPLHLLAGLGCQFLWNKFNRSHVRRPLAAVLMICLVFVSAQSFQTNYARAGEPQELFVQAGQATPQVKAWADQLYKSDQLYFAQTGSHLNVQIDSELYWPYGWYLRDFPTGTYAVLQVDQSPKLNPDIVFLPYWDISLMEGNQDMYEAFPYHHRWWWVPEFDVGISSISEFPDFLSSWGQWLWNREPWYGAEEGSPQCPASLSGMVYIRKSILDELKKFGVWDDPHQVSLPRYSNKCEELSTFR